VTNEIVVTAYIWFMLGMFAGIIAGISLHKWTSEYKTRQKTERKA